MGYISLDVNKESVLVLKQMFPPKFKRFIGHHVTVKFGVTETSALPKDSNVVIVGYCVDQEGIEALLVEVDGKTKREDGSMYHITWSLDPKKFKPVDSNTLIKTHKSVKTAKISIKTTPVFHK